MRAATGARRRPTTSPATPRVDKSLPLRLLETSPTYLHPLLGSPRPLCLCLSPPNPLSSSLHLLFPPPCLARPPLPSALTAVLRRHRGHSHRLAPPSCREAPPGSTPSSGAPRWSWEAPLTSHELVPFRPCRRRDPSNSGFPCAPKLPRAIGVPLGELSYLLPLLAYLARPLAASPRAPERSAAELVAGETPVTKWSRASAQRTDRTA